MSEQAPTLREPDQFDTSLGKETVADADAHRERALAANRDAQETAGRVFINGQPATPGDVRAELEYRKVHGRPSDG